MWLFLLIGLIGSYLLGNANGAVCVSALMRDDVRNHGSGNAGLTNFIRSYGTSRALLVIVIDALKAVLACLLTGFLLRPYGLFKEGMILGGVAVMVGHIFPVLLGFRGGKGILSGLFIALTVDWRVALMIVAVFFTVYFLTRYVSLSSVLAAVSFVVGFCVFYWGNAVVTVCSVFMAALTIFMHRSNIQRLLRGQEQKTDLFAKGKKK